eukprot:461671_1
MSSDTSLQNVWNQCLTTQSINDFPSYLYPPQFNENTRIIQLEGKPNDKLIYQIIECKESQIRNIIQHVTSNNSVTYLSENTNNNRTESLSSMEWTQSASKRQKINENKNTKISNNYNDDNSSDGTQNNTPNQQFNNRINKNDPNNMNQINSIHSVASSNSFNNINNNHNDSSNDVHNIRNQSNENIHSTGSYISDLDHVHNINDNSDVNVDVSDLNTQDLDLEEAWLQESGKKTSDTLKTYTIALRPVTDPSDVQHTYEIAMIDNTANCQIRLVWELKEEQNIIGALGIVKYYNHQNQLISEQIPFPSVQEFASNPKKIGSIFCTTLKDRLGLKCSFTPSITNKSNSLGNVYIERFILKSYAQTFDTFQSTHKWGLIQGPEKYFSFTNKTINLNTQQIIDPIQNNLFVDAHVRHKGICDHDLVRDYPYLVENQLFEPLPQGDCDFLHTNIGHKNITLMGTINSLQALSAGRIKKFKSYGGVKPVFLIYGDPKGGKSTTCSITQSTYGINEFHLDPSLQATSCVKIADFTVAGLEEFRGNYNGILSTQEDVDRSGNRQLAGGLYNLVWSNCDFAKSLTVARGSVAASESAVLVTINTPPEFIKTQDEGSKSRCLIWLYKPSFDRSTMTESQKIEVMRKLSEIIPRLMQRSVLILSTVASQAREKQATLVVDKFKSAIVSEHPSLTPYIDDRLLAMRIPLLANSCLHCKVYGQSSSVTISDYYEWIYEELKYNRDVATGGRLCLMVTKYSGDANVKKIFMYLLFLMKTLYTDLSLKPSNNKTELSDSEENDDDNDESDIKMNQILDENKDNIIIEHEKILKAQYLFRKHNMIQPLTRSLQDVSYELIALCSDSKIHKLNLKIPQLMKWFDQVICFNEKNEFKNIKRSDIQLFKFFVCGQSDWDNIMEIMKYNDYLFVNQKKYKNTIRISHNDTSYRYIALKLCDDKETKLLWKQISDDIAPRKIKKKIIKNKQASSTVNECKNVQNKNQTEQPIAPQADIALNLQNDMIYVLYHLISDQNSTLFMNPIQNVLSETDYAEYEQFYRPICLKDIQTNVKNNQYTNIQLFANDLRMIWSNCLGYNEETSNIYAKAIIMQKLCESLLVPVISKYYGQNNNNNNNTKITFNNSGTVSKQS